jgi:hypothetical protein
MLYSKTTRLHRGWLDRLKGIDRLYETKITDGYRVATGRGSTPDISQRSAQRRWVTNFGAETTEDDLLSPAPPKEEMVSTGPATLDEVTEALKADLGEIAGTLRAGAGVDSK